MTKKNITSLVITVLALGIVGYIAVKVIYPLLEAIVGTALAGAAVLVLLVLTGVISINTANKAWSVLLDASDSFKEEYDKAWKMGQDAYKRDCESRAGETIDA